MSFNIQNVKDEELTKKMNNLTLKIESINIDTISDSELEGLNTEKKLLLTEFYRRKFGEIVVPLIR